MGGVRFLLNGAEVSADGSATTTLLDWLREERRLTGTKEGCNEGDCGACTVTVSHIEDGKLVHRAQNACILFLPQLHGKAVRTVEGLAGPHGAPHPVQRAMIDEHGSQCGFCTPGIVMSLYAAHRDGRRDWNDVLAGNLCRCTGYAPILRAAEVAGAASQVSTQRQHKGVSHARIRKEEKNCMMPALKSTSVPGWADADEGSAREESHRAYQPRGGSPSGHTPAASSGVAAMAAAHTRRGVLGAHRLRSYFLPIPYSRSLLAMAVWETPSRLASWRVEGNAG